MGSSDHVPIQGDGVPVTAAPWPLLSYVLGSDRGEKAVCRVEDGIRRHTPFPYEVLISDFGEPALAPANLRFHGQIGQRFLIREAPRLGMARAYEAMFRRARGRYVVYLNDDAEVLAGTAAAAVGFMDSHPGVGVGALYYQEGAGSVWRVNDFRGCVYANFGIVRREVGDLVGWFGGGVVEMYGAENVLTFEVLRAGFGVVAIPGTRVVHHVDASARKERDSERCRPAASTYLDRAYPPDLMARLRATHDRYRRLGGDMQYPPQTWGDAR